MGNAALSAKKHSFAQGLGSTTPRNVFSASLTASSGKKAATHSSDALTHPRSGMLLFFPTEGGKHYHVREGDLSTIRKKHFSAIEANWEFLGICGDFWSNISSSGPNRSMGLSFNHFSIRIKRALTANASNLQNTCLSSTLWGVGVSSSTTSALPCSTTNRVPPWIQGKPSVRQRTD